MNMNRLVSLASYVLWVLIGLFVQGLMIMRLRSGVDVIVVYIAADLMLWATGWAAAYTGTSRLLLLPTEEPRSTRRFIRKSNLVNVPLLALAMWISPAVVLYMLVAAVGFLPTFAICFGTLRLLAIRVAEKQAGLAVSAVTLNPSQPRETE